MGFNLTTFVFEVINFLVLLFVLDRLVYRPLRRGIAARREALQAREDEATKAAAAAQALKGELEERARSIDELRQQALRDASVAGAEERARILEQAREDAAVDHARAQHLIEAEREASEVAIRELAIKHATALASRLLTQLAPGALEDALLGALTAELERQAAGWREGPATEEEVEVTWAHSPDERRRARLKEALGQALGDGARIVHREDPSLGAGVVLRFGHRVLDASTSGQLGAVGARARALAEEGAGE